MTLPAVEQRVASPRIVVVSRGDLVHLNPFLHAMRDDGCDLILAALSPWTDPIDGVPCQPCFLGRVPKPLAYTVGAWKLRRLCQAARPSMIWGHYASSSGAVAWLSGWRPYGLTAHGSDVLDRTKTRLGERLMKPILRSAAFLHAVSPDVAERSQQMGVAGRKLITIPFGIDIADIPFREPAFRKPIRLVCTRNLRYPVYDVPTILRAVAILKSDHFDVRLTICGSGQLQPQMEALAQSLQIMDRVRFLGGYAYEQLVSILHDHDIYVSASLSDGASLSLFEAMAGGLFPVVSDIAANRNWLDDEESFFPPSDAQALATRIRQASRRSEICGDIVRKNRQVVERRADRSANMRKILDFVYASPVSQTD